MQEDDEDLPMMTVDEVILSNQEYQSMHKKMQENIFKLAYIASSSHEYPKGKAFNENLLNRYQFSKYLIDPNHRRFTVVMRIQSHVFRFINILKQRVQNKRNGLPTRSYQAEVPPLTEEEIIAAKVYFFKKATLEGYDRCTLGHHRFPVKHLYTGKVSKTSSLPV